MKRSYLFKNTSVYAVFISASIIALAMIQLFFLQVMGNEKTIVSSNINNFFIDHKILVNPYHIAQALSDYESFKMLRCSKLIKKNIIEPEIVFLDLSYKGDCRRSDFWLNGINFSQTYTAGNGDLWRFEGFVVASDSILALFWAFRICSLLFIIALIVSYRLRIINLQRDAVFRALKDRQRADIMQNLAHDIKNPLAVFELISASKTWEEFLDWQPEMTRSISRIHAIIADFNKDADEISLQIEPDTLDLCAIAADANKTMGSAQVTVRAESQSDGVPLRIDKMALERSIFNLITNAVEAGARAISVYSKINGTDLILSVVDDGPGVSGNIIDHLFQRGQSFGKHGGQGIGLFNVKSIAVGHGGGVSYRRDNDLSVFEISLPGVVLENVLQTIEGKNKSPTFSQTAQQSVLIAIESSARKEAILSALANYPMKIYLDEAGDPSTSLVFTDDNDLIGKYLAVNIPIMMENGKDDPEKIAKQIVRRLRGRSDIRHERIDQL